MRLADLSTPADSRFALPNAVGPAHELPSHKQGSAQSTAGSLRLLPILLHLSSSRGIRTGGRNRDRSRAHRWPDPERKTERERVGTTTTDDDAFHQHRHQHQYQYLPVTIPTPTPTKCAEATATQYLCFVVLPTMSNRSPRISAQSRTFPSQSHRRDRNLSRLS